MAAKVFKNAKNDKGQPIDSDGDRIIDLRNRNDYYVTSAHPNAKAHGGVGTKIQLSPHTHGPRMVKKGWVSIETVEKEPKGKKAEKA